MNSRGGQFEQTRQSPRGGWADILKRTSKDVSRDHCTVLAGGVAFFILIGIVPALAALIGIYALVSDPAQIQQQFASMKGAIPPEAHTLVNRQIQKIASSQTTAGWGAALGIVVALWSGSKAVKALIEGLNVAYHEEEKRGFIKLNLIAVLLTFAGIAGVAIMIGLIAVLPEISSSLGPGNAHVWVNVVRWPLLLACFILALTVLYRWGPSRERAQRKWVSWGAISAAVLWLAASALFSFYVVNFGNYNKTYGALGAVVVLLMWFYISAYCVLLGAELDSEMLQLDRQAESDGTATPAGAA